MVRLVFRLYTQLRWLIGTSEPLRTSIRVSPDVIQARHSSPSFGSQHLCLPPFLSLFSTVVSVQNMLPYIGNGWKGGNLEGILWLCDAQNTKFNSQYLCHHRSYKGSENLQQTQQQHHFKLTTNPTVTPFLVVEVFSFKKSHTIHKIPSVSLSWSRMKRMNILDVSRQNKILNILSPNSQNSVSQSQLV